MKWKDNNTQFLKDFVHKNLKGSHFYLVLFNIMSLNAVM